MAWKWNPFTNNLDYYQVSSGSGGSSFTLTHVTNFSALPDPTTVGLYDVFIVDNAQGNRFWYGSIGGTYYPSGAYYSDLTKWIYSESASKATQAEVDAGTNTEKYVTPETLNNYSGWNKTKVGLENVDNTSDLDKPISTATQTALDLITDINWLGDYNNGYTYTVGDGVMFNGASFRMYNAIGAAGYSPQAFPGNWLQITEYVSPNDIGLEYVDNTSDLDKPISTATQTALDLKADLVGGTVPSSQLPSYVDDVIEGYYSGGVFYSNAGLTTPIVGELGKIYVDLLQNKSYRWSGSIYVQISNAISSIDELTDVTISSPTNGQLLQYNLTTSQWENHSVTSGNGDMQKSTYDIDNDGIVDYAETISVVVRNPSITDILRKGTIVYLSGSTGNRPNAYKARANAESTSSGTFGAVVADIGLNSDGSVAALGTLHDLDTRTSALGNPYPFTNDTLLDGDVIWLDPNTAGYVTKIKPQAPNHIVFIGTVARTTPNFGRIIYRIVNGFELDELHNVFINGSLANNDVLYYDATTSLWKARSISATLGYTPANKAGDTFTGSISATNLSGTNTGDETITTIKSKLGITTLSGSNTGDQDLSGLVVKNATIVGATNTKITYDSKGLVTSGTNATTADIADTTNKRYTTDAQQTILGNTSNTNSGDETTGTIQTKLGVATTASDGYLTAADWNTFYGKQASLGYTPVNKAGDTMSSYLILNADPTASLGAATKQYVDNLASGINFHSPAHAATTINLVANYTNGTSGVNAKLTATTDGALIVDNHTMLQYERLLVWQQSNAFENGVYDVTATGDSTHPFELTRSTDADNNPAGEIAYGDFLFVQKGDTYGGVGFIVNTAGTINIGSTNISYVQFNAAQIVSAGYGLQELTPNVLSVDTSLIQTKLSAATSSVDGYLTFTDWGTFNGKQDALSGTGFVKISGTTVSYDNSTYQPLDTDLTAIAALTTDPFGLDLLTKSDAASIRSYIGAGTGSGIGDALTTNPLSQFASTTSAELAGVLSDETGTGSVVFSDSPALIGIPTAPTASPLTNTTQVATTEYVDTAVSIVSGDFIPALPITSYPQGYYANNGSATLSIMGNVATAALSGTASLNSIVGTNTLTRTVRITIPTSSTVGAKAGVRTAALRHSVGQGFLFSVCWMIQDAAFVTGAKQFHGLLPITTLSTISNTVDVVSLVNLIGVGSDAADLNLQVFYNDATGVASKIDLGSNFPANRTAGAVMNNVYVFEMYNEPSTTTVKYRITERSSGNTAQGEITTNLPAAEILLASQSIRTNGATALATSTQWSHLIGYIL
jgi:hypothetical protein